LVFYEDLTTNPSELGPSSCFYSNQFQLSHLESTFPADAGDTIIRASPEISFFRVGWPSIRTFIIMAGIPKHKYDLLPYSTTLSSISHDLNYTHHRPSKREHIDSSDGDEPPSSPPRKYRGRKRREWRDSSDLGYSSDVDEELRRAFTSSQQQEIIHRRSRTVTNGEPADDQIFSSQPSQDTPTSKFHRILTNAIMDGLDSIDFSYAL